MFNSNFYTAPGSSTYSTSSLFTSYEAPLFTAQPQTVSVAPPSSNAPLSREAIDAACAAFELLAGLSLQEHQTLFPQHSVRTGPAVVSYHSASNSTSNEVTPRSDTSSLLLAGHGTPTDPSDLHHGANLEKKKRRRGRRGGVKTQERRRRAIEAGRPAHKPQKYQNSYQNSPTNASQPTVVVANFQNYSQYAGSSLSVEEEYDSDYLDEESLLPSDLFD